MITGLLLLAGCSSIQKVVQQPLPYHNKLQLRDISSVDMIVIHCTELPTLELSREFGETVHYKSGTGNSGHYYIDKDGVVYQYVADNRVANHVRGHNEHSIGIEIINNGRYPDWYTTGSQQNVEAYTPQQVHSVIKLVHRLSEQYPSIRNIAGHQELDQSLMPSSDDPNIKIRRKVDPGPLFPWAQLMSTVELSKR
ncbi:MAG: N-acetylmuramoyl-L-alanine amidase [Algicola sp.]|nr:N-acetylmuramoyl-L-alanine amidase [Algicola sp.]